MAKVKINNKEITQNSIGVGDIVYDSRKIFAEIEPLLVIEFLDNCPKCLPSVLVQKTDSTFDTLLVMDIEPWSKFLYLYNKNISQAKLLNKQIVK